MAGGAQCAGGRRLGATGGASLGFALRGWAIVAAALALLPATALAVAVTLASSAPEAPAAALPAPAFPVLATPDGTEPDGSDVRVGIPTAEADLVEEALTAAGDHYAAAVVGLSNAAIRNGTSTVNHLARRELPDRELFNLTNAGVAFANAAGQGTVAFAGDSVVLVQVVAAAKLAEADALEGRSGATVAMLGGFAEGFGLAVAADVPVAALGIAAEAQRLVEGVSVDPAPAQAPVQAALDDAQSWAAGTSTLAQLHLAALQADAGATVAQELAMQGVIGAEIAAASTAAAGAGTSAAAYQQALVFLGYDTAEAMVRGVDEGAVVVPFSAVEVAGAESATLLGTVAFVVRDGGVDALDGSDPVRARVRSGLATGANVTVASGEALGQLQLAGHGLLDAACADPFAQPAPQECGPDSLATRTEAVLQTAEDAATVSAGAARNRVAVTFDGQASGAIAAANTAARSLSLASSKVASGATQSAVAVPLSDAEAAFAAGSNYAAATEARLAALGPGLASDLSAEPGQALFRTVALAAGAGRAAGDAALAAESAASTVVNAALR